MSPTSDAEIYAATYRAMQRLDPGELTLAEIAAEAGVTAGALVQRFGSKRDLLLALSRAAAASAGDLIAGLREEVSSPLAALRRYAECMAEMAASPAALSRSLAYLQIDLTDPDFRKQLTAHARATRAGLRALVAEAIEAGELRPDTDAERLARTIETMLGGSLLTWAHYREGPAAAWLRDDLEAVLAPNLAKSHLRAARRNQLGATVQSSSARSSRRRTR